MEEWKIVCSDNDYPEKWLTDMKEANEALLWAFKLPIPLSSCVAWRDIQNQIPQFKKAMFQNGFYISMGDRLNELKNDLDRV